MTDERFVEEADKLYHELANTYTMFLYTDAPDYTLLRDISFRLKKLTQNIDCLCDVYHKETGVIV